MRALLVFLTLLAPMVSSAQQVDKLIFFGPGMSSSLVNGAKSVSVIVGGKLVIHLGTGGWFSQLSCSASFVEPQGVNPKSYWSTRPSASLGYRFRGGKSRFSTYGAFGETRNRAGDFLPTAIGGVIVNIKGHWGFLVDISRNSQAWGTSATLGYKF
jgi:hypothetical protein